MIRLACATRFSTKDDRTNQGFGLPGLVRDLRRQAGFGAVASRFGLVHFPTGRVYARALESLPVQPVDGTLTILRLPLRS
jgi:hypothetical protein